VARNLRDLRRKIKGVKSTRQVTKAMELVSASKMRRAIQNAMQLRKYSGTARGILARINAHAPDALPGDKSTAGNVLIILFTSDRGLAGSLNTQMTRTAHRYVQALEKLPGFQSVSFIAVGKKGQQYLARTQRKIIAAFPSFSNRPTFRDILPVTRMAMEGFNAGTYDHVVIMYMDFVNVLQQKPAAQVLLPFGVSALAGITDELAPESNVTENAASGIDSDYKFEPSPEEVLRTITPQIVDMQVYQALLEATASEHSARMVAMRNASDNADDLIGDLTLDYNSTRQAGITAELAELSASAAALEG
jgi:F-type H+-transporting ATPase subunit gamma